MKRNALVGYTGFVGSNINTQAHFDDLYNSSNIHDLGNKKYDLLVFSGIPAVKWLANKEPEKDLEIIQNIENILKTIHVKKFILISTIDVYPVIKDTNEDYNCTSLPNHAYGTNRLRFEKFCTTQFTDCMIVRLPALFGDGIKKNVIYDLLNDNCLEMINPDSSFQYYFLDRLWSDIEKANKNGIKLINLFTEPISTKDIIMNFFPNKLAHIGAAKTAEMHYDLHTKYAYLWGHEKYRSIKKELLYDLDIFIKRYRDSK